MTAATEVNFDALVGPTHNYAGLAHGNLASRRHGGSASNPRAAALEGLRKMKLLADLGLKQAILPPQHRPDVDALRHVGFTGIDAQVLESAYRADPVLLAACCSASATWAANAATVSPSADTADGRVHFTPANLVSQFHRSLEPPTTAAALRANFADPAHFMHHPPLPPSVPFSDEGAANHVRLAATYGEPGLELFLFGRHALDATQPRPQRYPARQTREAFVATARLHLLNEQSTLLIQQNPDAIDAGVFHNDVISVGNLDVLLCHERAFLNRPEVLATLRARFATHCGRELQVIEATERELPIEVAVRSYLFNSQLVTLPNGQTALIAPREVEESAAARRFVEKIVGHTAIKSVHYVDVRQSMRNGGGPACLRLRVVLNERELAATHQGVFLTPTLLAQLESWIHRHYREHLAPADLRDPQLLDESRAALDELTRVLALPAIYPFQH